MDRYSKMYDMSRPQSAHPKMAVSNRAKQFMPMDALRGFSVAVLAKQREKQLVAKASLSEDMQAELEWKLHLLRPGDTISVTYFKPEKIIGDLQVGTYVADTERVVGIYLSEKALALSHTHIPFDDIYEIKSSSGEENYD